MPVPDRQTGSERFRRAVQRATIEIYDGDMDTLEAAEEGALRHGVKHRLADVYLATREVTGRAA